MTIHASKGLEFKAVFVVNLDQKIRKDTSLPRITEYSDGNIEITAITKNPNSTPNRACEEEKRLLYVALTRAKEYLVLSALDTNQTRSYTAFTDLLPKTLQEIFSSISTTREQELFWSTSHARHKLRIIRANPQPAHFQIPPFHSEKNIALTPLSSPDISISSSEKK